MKVDISIDLKSLAVKLNAEMAGDYNENTLITGIMPIEDAGTSELSFISSDKFITKAQNSKAACILCPQNLEIPGKTLLRVNCVWTAVIQVLKLFYPPKKPGGKIHPTAIVHPDLKTGQNVSIGAYSIIEEGTVIGDNTHIDALCYIGRNVTIGESVIIKPNTGIFEDVIIGDRVIIHAGSVIGSDGFRYEPIDGVPVKIPQVGKVVIEDDVEIGANCCIDRAFLKETRIRRGAKLDNLIQIAHNVDIGDYTIIAAQCGIAGSTRIGNACLFGGQSGTGDHIIIGDNVKVGGKSGVTHNVKDGERLFGTPASNAREFMKREAVLRKLPELLKKYKKDIEELKKAVDALSQHTREPEKGGINNA